MDDLREIQFRLHLTSPPEKVFWHLSTDEGRSLFWAESSRESDGHILFRFPNGASWRGEILESSPMHRFRLIYYGGSTTTFDLTSDGQEGTNLLLTDSGVPLEDQNEVLPGWVSVLLALKAAVDFGVDLRNHDPARTWDQKYVDN